MSEQADLFQDSSKSTTLGLDEELYQQGLKLIVGIDEAGRGPLAGPVTAAAVRLSRSFSCPLLNDSKKLTEGVRETLFNEFHKRRNIDIAFGVGFASAEEIDQLGILPANFLAMRRALRHLELPGGSTLSDFCLLIDGRDRIPDLPTIKQIAVVRGDSKARCIAAASVLAKVSRDREMVAQAKKYPQYGFQQHKGYGTRAHLRALNEFGACPIHRRSFAPVRKCLQPS